MTEKETHREKKISTGLTEGECLNKPWQVHWMEYCATIEMMFTEGL